jgi:hypothetical protein
LVAREVTAEMDFFSLSKDSPTKGEKLFSLGNPHDLGMIVVPGTYNGLKKESFSDRIHFTGSINSGMSGGPVVNKDAEVVGINVATSGNQIGFLVPHGKLISLFSEFKKSPPNDIKQQMAAQLLASQNELITALLDSKWQPKNLGSGGVIPIIDIPFIRCWGDSNADKTDALILTAVASCSLDEDIYLSSNFYTGNIEIEFRHMQAKDLSDTKFYHLYEQQIARAGAGNQAGKRDVSEFQCQHDLTSPQNNDITNKSIFCARAYKDFPELFDVLYLGASVDKKQEALVSHFTIAGISKKNAMAFTHKFMESVSWK